MSENRTSALVSAGAKTNKIPLDLNTQTKKRLNIVAHISLKSSLQSVQLNLDFMPSMCTQMIRSWDNVLALGQAKYHSERSY